MAQLNQAFDATQVQPMEEFKPLPEGDYLAIIESSEMKPTKAGTGMYLELTFQVIDPDLYKGRKLWERLNLQNQSQKTVEIAQRAFSAICHAAGVLNVNDSEQLHNIPMSLSVGIDKKDSDHNVIKAFKSASASAPAMAPAANTAPPFAQQTAPVQQQAVPVQQAPQVQQAAPQQQQMQQPVAQQQAAPAQAMPAAAPWGPKA